VVEGAYQEEHQVVHLGPSFQVAFPSCLEDHPSYQVVGPFPLEAFQDGHPLVEQELEVVFEEVQTQLDYQHHVLQVPSSVGLDLQHHGLDPEDQQELQLVL